MDDSLDLDAFIANMEQSAPQEDIDREGHVCQECNNILEETDEGNFVCPNCSAQATNLVRLEATECYQDETGRDIVGARVRVSDKGKYNTDYGWAWSTDEAIIHLLSLQLDALEKSGLVTDKTFRLGVKNMWFKFWVQNIAPYIKDQYNEGDLIPLETMRALKYRDIEVLVKVQEKVMIPEKQMIKERAEKLEYKMMNIKFFKKKPISVDINGNDDENANPVIRSQAETPDSTQGELMANLTGLDHEGCSDDDDDDDEEENSIDAAPQIPFNICKTQNIGANSISILTLNRTLAFIEATARCLIDIDYPLFASDIIRACNQRIVPFYGAHKNLPDGMNLNYRDSHMFNKTRPPSPVQLTAAACLLIHKIYRDDLPLTIPIPDFDKVLLRLVRDLNLPNDLLNHIDPSVNFHSFKQTRPTIFRLLTKRTTLLPQYDRWAFVILLCNLKKLFGVTEASIDEQYYCAKNDMGNNFVFFDWLKQLSIRLQFIMSYDPYVLFHPMTEVKNIQPNPQVYNYVETILSDKVETKTRLERATTRNDDSFRTDLTEFCARHIPKPPSLNNCIVNEEYLEAPVDVRHPIKDAIERTKRFWVPALSEDPEMYDLVFDCHQDKKIITTGKLEGTNIYDSIMFRSGKYQIIADWPYCFKLLLSIGGYICYCEPQELLGIFRTVERFLYPEARLKRKYKRPRNDDSIN